MDLARSAVLDFTETLDALTSTQRSACRASFGQGFSWGVLLGFLLLLGSAWSWLGALVVGIGLALALLGSRPRRGPSLDSFFEDQFSEDLTRHVEFLVRLADRPPAELSSLEAFAQTKNALVDQQSLFLRSLKFSLIGVNANRTALEAAALRPSSE
jgi:hypothetical protein